MIKTKSMNKKLYHKTSTYLSHSVLQSTMEKTSPSNRRREELHYDLRDELLKACISRERTNSKRLSASSLTSFREEARSFRYTTTFSSTASSPRYPTRADYVDPSTYSFTAALKALQTRSGRDFSSQPIKSILNGIPLQSKWNEAERFICNPYSGEVPQECLSSKTLSRSVLINSNRIAKSGPLVFSYARGAESKSTITHGEESPVAEIKSFQKHRSSKRDVGTQSTPPDRGSCGASPDSAPPIKEILQISCRMEEEKLSFQDQPKPQQNEQVEGREKQKVQRTKKGEGNKMFKCKLGPCWSWGPWVRKQERANLEEMKTKQK